MNLLQETIQVLHKNNKTTADVVWVGSPNYTSISWLEFASLADIEYDAGYGASKVATDLVVVGKDFWLSRGEYDGSEWWAFNTLPIRPENYKPVQAVTIDQALALDYDIACGWQSLGRINGDISYSCGDVR